MRRAGVVSALATLSLTLIVAGAGATATSGAKQGDAPAPAKPPATAAPATPAPAPKRTECGSEDTPAALVCRFYHQYLELEPFGLPTPTERRTLDPYLSQRLRRALDAAAEQQMTFMRTHPGEKPPFVDGSLFTSLFEGARTYRIVHVHTDPDTGTIVRVRFEYDPRTQWDDRVIVKRERDHLVIEDVLFSGIGEFDPPGRLSEILRRREP